MARKAEQSHANRRFTSEGAPIFLASAAAFESLDAPGRRGVRIFAMPRQHLIMAAVGGVIVGFPIAFFISLAPFWDHVGELSMIRKLNSLVAPGIEGIRHTPLPDFPLKRSLIALTSMVELLFLGNFVALFSRGFRRHALLVWTCHDQGKLLLYLAISGLLFCSCWYVLFFDWETLAYLSSGPRNRIAHYMAIALPLVAYVFGHLATIVGLGVCRRASRALRWVRSSAPTTNLH